MTNTRKVWIVTTNNLVNTKSGDETTAIHAPAFFSQAAAQAFADSLNAGYATGPLWKGEPRKHATAGWLWIDEKDEELEMAEAAAA